MGMYPWAKQHRNNQLLLPDNICYGLSNAAPWNLSFRSQEWIIDINMTCYDSFVIIITTTTTTDVMFNIYKVHNT